MDKKNNEPTQVPADDLSDSSASCDSDLSDASDFSSGTDAALVPRSARTEFTKKESRKLRRYISDRLHDCRVCRIRTFRVDFKLCTTNLRRETSGTLFVNPAVFTQFQSHSRPSGKVEYVYRRHGCAVAVLHVAGLHVEAPYAREWFEQYARKEPFNSHQPVYTTPLPSRFPVHVPCNPEPSRKRRKLECADLEDKTVALFVNPFLTDGMQVTARVHTDKLATFCDAEWMAVEDYSPANVPWELFAVKNPEAPGTLWVPAQPLFAGLVLSALPFPSASAIDTWSKAYEAAAKNAPQAYLDLFEKLSPQAGVWTETVREEKAGLALVSDLHGVLECARTCRNNGSYTFASGVRGVWLMNIDLLENPRILVTSANKKHAALLHSKTLARGKTFHLNRRVSRVSMLEYLRFSHRQDPLQPGRRAYVPHCKVDHDAKWSVCRSEGLHPSADSKWSPLPLDVCDVLETLASLGQAVAEIQLDVDGSEGPCIVVLDAGQQHFVCSRVRRGGELCTQDSVFVLRRTEATAPEGHELHVSVNALPESLKGISYWNLVEYDRSRLFADMALPTMGRVTPPSAISELKYAFHLGNDATLCRIDMTNRIQTSCVKLFVEAFVAGMQLSTQMRASGNLQLNRMRIVSVDLCFNPIYEEMFLTYASAVLQDVMRETKEPETALNLATCFLKTNFEDADKVVLEPFGLTAHAQLEEQQTRRGPGLRLFKCSAASCAEACTGATSLRAMIVGVAALGLDTKPDYFTSRIKLRNKEQLRCHHSGTAHSPEEEAVVPTQSAFLPVIKVTWDTARP